MQQEYYTLPLSVDRLMNRQEHPKCNLQQSVYQNLHLLLTTSFGEFPADEKFGCSIWDNDFDNLTSAAKIKENIRQSVLQAVQQYETRLAKVRVEVLINQEELSELKGKIVKKKIDITISGFLQLTNEKFVYRDSFFMGPLSY
jgi:phage baseplate assembly protein W